MRLSSFFFLFFFFYNKMFPFYISFFLSFFLSFLVRQSVSYSFVFFMFSSSFTLVCLGLDVDSHVICVRAQVQC